MSINIKDLGNNFKIEAINQGNDFKSELVDNTFKIRPGTYILSKKGHKKTWENNQAFKTNKLNDFYAPSTNVTQLWITHKPLLTISENNKLNIKVECIAPEQPKEIIVTGYNSNGNYFNSKLESKGDYIFSTDLSEDYIKNGYLYYNIIVRLQDNSQITYPSGKTGNLYDWDFYDRTPYKVTVLKKESPIYLFNALEDTDKLVRQWRRTFKLEPTDLNNEAEYQIQLDKLFFPDNENLKAEPIYDYSFKHFILDKIEGRKSDLSLKKRLVFKGRALNNKSCKLQIAFVLDDGSSYGKTIDIGTNLDEYSINIKDLKPVKTVTLPRPYPSFLPYYFEHQNTTEFNIDNIESIQFSIGPEIPKEELEDQHGISIVHVRLE